MTKLPMMMIRDLTSLISYGLKCALSSDLSGCGIYLTK